MKNIFFILLAFIFIQCDNSLDIDMTSVNGLAPIYTQLEIGDLVSEEPRVYETVDQIEYFDKYILVIEKEKGIHIVDNGDLDDPMNIAFLNLPGISSFIIKDDFLVASLANHLLSIEIIDFTNSSILSMVDQPSPNGFGSYPTIDFNGRFECVDLSKGIVIGWEMKSIINPQCEIFR